MECFRMKMVFRIIVTVIWNLLTLPFQFGAIAIILLTNWTDEEMEQINDFCVDLLHNGKNWIKTGRFEEPED